ncbi:MAG: hypothetical protein KKG47_10120 [Proteobacteria bacterium]|nr:hypothetical protein [Pseudomonadota bacterium]MBU1737667.1 hypothetical protein [Pseudomonadota bacterium]
MFYGIYRLLTRLFCWSAFPLFIAYSLATGRHRKSLKQRLGFYERTLIPANRSTVIWIHAASVGEVKAAKILIEGLTRACSGIHIVLTTVTEQGLEVARKELGNAALCLYAPLDFPGSVARAARFISPAVYICLETELWPNLLKELHGLSVRMFLLNARISARSCRRYLVFKKLAGELLAGFSAIAAISGKDGDRLVKLGADENTLFVSGNVKYDLPEPEAPETTAAHYRKVLGLTEENTVIVGGSTHTGEEAIMVKAFRELRQTLSHPVLILAPRHLSRLGDLCRELSALGAAHELQSSIKAGNRKNDIIIVDTMGSLAEIYSVADYIFCGGSLVERGGHNLIEAARWGIPVFYGPSMKDFHDAKLILEENGGGFMVESGADFVEKIKNLAEDHDRYRHVSSGARKTALLQHGAAEKQLAPVIKALREMTA